MLLKLANSSPETDNGWNDGTATITPSGGMSPYNYLWNDPSSQTNSTATGLSTGDYIVMVTDDNGCVFSDTVNVGSTTFIDDNGNEIYIKVYPNPIIENVTIETNSTKEYHLSLYDLSGKLIEKIEGLKGVSELQRKLLPSGMYMLSVELDDNQFNYPVIIE